MNFQGSRDSYAPFHKNGLDFLTTSVGSFLLGGVQWTQPPTHGNQTLIKYVKANLTLCLTDSDWKLLLVKTRIPVGTLPRGQMIYRIAKVLVVTLGPCSTKDLDVEVRSSL